MPAITAAKKKRLKRNKKIYASLMELLAQPDAMMMGCQDAVMKEFKISRATVRNIVREFKQGQPSADPASHEAIMTVSNPHSEACLS